MWPLLKRSAIAVACFIWRLGPRLASLAFVVALIFLIMFAILDTRRDVAYRYSAPDSRECAAWSSPENSTVLASDDVNNDERVAVRKIRSDKADHDDPFTCMLQFHAMKPGFVPRNPDLKAGNPAIGYYLS